MDYLEEAREMLKSITLDGIAEGYMDDDIREAVHSDPKMWGVSDEEWLAEYMKRHEEKYGEKLTI